ncbi:phosphatidylinositol transfer protein 3-like [Salvia divinorum]|uniref:Phosphatidylinositol transfer protein 3-like n=1 Tax=Salvia divinorum TaxID=28513 RepID=A0ABD1GVE7_SALDI
MSAGEDESLSPETQQAKINEVRKSLWPLSGKLAIYCSDGCIARYLRARNWNTKKATKMLKASLKWRSEYMPEEIRWDDVAAEAETGKIYRSAYKDKHGRPVLVMRPRCQNTKSIKGQIKYLVYCMENAILNLGEEQEQMVWLIDFHGFSLSNVSLKVTKETAHVLQNHYPERLGVAILYDAPKIFEPFWKMAKPFLEPKTANKVKFVYSDDPNTNKIMDELFDMGMVESAFSGKDGEDFDINKYATRMRKDDEKLPFVWRTHHSLISPPPVSTAANPTSSDSDPEALDMIEEKAVISSDEDKDTRYY